MGELIPLSDLDGEGVTLVWEHEWRDDDSLRVRLASATLDLGGTARVIVGEAEAVRLFGQRQVDRWRDHEEERERCRGNPWPARMACESYHIERDLADA